MEGEMTTLSQEKHGVSHQCLNWGRVWDRTFGSPISGASHGHFDFDFRLNSKHNGRAGIYIRPSDAVEAYPSTSVSKINQLCFNIGRITNSPLLLQQMIVSQDYPIGSANMKSTLRSYQSRQGQLPIVVALLSPYQYSIALRLKADVPEFI